MTSSTLKHEIHETFSHGVIYVYSIPDERHKGRLKIGAATTNINSQEAIETAARKRIAQQIKTADVPYTLQHAELAVTDGNMFFSDVDVHAVLRRSGIFRKSVNIMNMHSEWFAIDLTS